MIRPIARMLCLLFALSSPAFGHEFWIEVKSYHPVSEGPIVADLKNGQMFDGVPFAWFDGRIDRFDVIVGKTVTPVTGRAGDVPAVTITTPQNGLNILVHQRKMDTLTYQKWDKFLNFASGKGYPDIQARHRAMGLSDPPFKEGYTRYCKALVAVGDGHGEDRETGLDFEFVALTSPYQGDRDQLAFRLFHEGAPLPDHVVALFEKPTNGGAVETAYRTDMDGVVTVPVRPGYRYLIDAVILRPATPQEAADKGLTYVSLWASTTFEMTE